MFTGIIEEIGEIAGVKRGQVSSRLAIRGKKIFSDLKLGDSVAVNGVCLTATSISGDIFEADVMAETLRRTNLGGFSNGTRVNLERAMAAGGRFGARRRTGSYHWIGESHETDDKRIDGLCHAGGTGAGAVLFGELFPAVPGHSTARC